MHCNGPRSECVPTGLQATAAGIVRIAMTSFQVNVIPRMVKTKVYIVFYVVRSVYHILLVSNPGGGTGSD